jgi:hypothetical protein
MRRLASNPADPDMHDEWPVEGPIPDLPYEALAHSLFERFRTLEAGTRVEGRDSEADCEGDGEAGCEGLEENPQADNMDQDASIGEGWELVELSNPTDEVD